MIESNIRSFFLPGCLFLAAFLIAGCAANSVRLEHGSAFADAGIAYVDALPAILDESFALSVAADSLMLGAARDDLSPDERVERLKTSNALLEQRLVLLRDIRQHALLLRSYFLALRAIAAGDGAGSISDATGSLVERLAALRPQIADKAAGGATPQGLVQPAVRAAAEIYQGNALKRELSVHGQAIERELALQDALLRTLVEDMRANADLKTRMQDLNPVFEAFYRPGQLPGDWAERRVAALRRSVDYGGLDKVLNATGNLHATWVALVEDRADKGSLDLLTSDISRLLAVVEGLHTGGGGAAGK